MSVIENFLSLNEEHEIVSAIRSAELKTSGEIRVHLENSTKDPIFERAYEVFHQLKMDNTKLSNGVLIYLAIADKSLVILGDKGINDLVEDSFWDSTKDLMVAHFKKEQFKEGLIAGIQEAGKQLSRYFPIQLNDEDELPNQISRS